MCACGIRSNYSQDYNINYDKRNIYHSIQLHENIFTHQCTLAAACDSRDKQQNNYQPNTGYCTKRYYYKWLVFADTVTYMYVITGKRLVVLRSLPRLPNTLSGSGYCISHSE